MALSKARTSIWSSQSLVAGAGDTNSSWIDLSAVHESTLSIKLTNGATGPTVAAQVAVELANDYNAGSPNLVVESQVYEGGTDNNGEYEWGGIVVPIGIGAVRLVAGSNTGQNVTVDADIGKATL